MCSSGKGDGRNHRSVCWQCSSGSWKSSAVGTELRGAVQCLQLWLQRKGHLFLLRLSVCGEAPSVPRAAHATGEGIPACVRHPLIAFTCLSSLLLWYSLLLHSQVALSCRQGPRSLISARIRSSPSRSHFRSQMQAAHPLARRGVGSSKTPRSATELRAWLRGKLALRFSQQCFN